ncbi:MAG: T9SS type A sorting domain-containing protein [Bacteroidales bacterium]|nr:T9SS type A sorting domain-containing protein [Bacteroidales bacterium]
MKNKLKLLIIACFVCIYGHAQSGFVTVGSDVTTENGSVNFSVGQVFYNSYESESLSLTQGVQQPYTITSLPVKDVEISTIQLTAYPNPTADVLNLLIEGVEPDGLSYTISDINARIQMKGAIDANETQIDVARLLAGVYFVEVHKKNVVVRAFKVVKQ